MEQRAQVRPERSSLARPPADQSPFHGKPICLAQGCANTRQMQLAGRKLVVATPCDQQIADFLRRPLLHAA
jgi:hypothetical protein